MARQQTAPQQEWLITVGKESDDLELFRFNMLTPAPAARIRDYSAGMLDTSFLRQAAAIACEVPERICLPD